uniref:Polycystic kidney disease protein 1-like 3 n=1 Tax=Castor canadensis TaxID=51338 RepID=A0A8B7VJB0_CASCN|nr:polycystic kidney disease protein 1-like 3 [Castor canadensis]
MTPLGATPQDLPAASSLSAGLSVIRGFPGGASSGVVGRELLNFQTRATSRPLRTLYFRTLCHPTSPSASVIPKTTPQATSVPSAPYSPLQPEVTALTRPVATTPAGRPVTNLTSSPNDSQPGVATTHPQMPWHSTFHETPGKPVENFSRASPASQAHSDLEKACEVLQKLRDFSPRFPTPAQVSVISLLIDLRDKLLRLLFQNKSQVGFKTPAAVCLFHSLSSGIKDEKEREQDTKQDTGQTTEQDTEQVEDLLELALLALGKIQEAFLQQNPHSESSVTLTSSIAALMLSSQNMSTLPLSSYTLGDPAPMRLGFPSASALEALLNKHPGVKVHVTGLAFNPFKTSDSRHIIGSIGNVLLSSDQELLQVHDLVEDIEITLWRNSSVDIHPTIFNTSMNRFTITVNITSLEKSLIVTIEPESPLLMTLYLGFQDQPGHTHFHLNITLPKGQLCHKDEEYTWVLTPESLQYGIGTYYITAVLSKSTDNAQPMPTLVSVLTAVTQCYFWDKHNRTWKSNGCQVGQQSTVLRTQCLCNHLTFFASDFFVVPRTVDIEDTVELFLHVTKNPVGVSLLASVLGFYMILVVWAWRKDQADTQKVKVTVLADNDPSSQFHYLIQVFTGYRRSAATTAKVAITLYGSEGRSEPHHLCDAQKTVFERGALDVFLLSTASSLGELHSLRLWHDNSGSSPSWYVSQVIVSDMAAKRKWHFLCNCWLAVDLGDFERDQVFMPASRRELFSFRNVFFSMIVEKFTQDYLWLSVLTRHPWNQFTRVQRLTCCVTLLLCDMLINVMFWKMSSTTAKRNEQVGPFVVTRSEVFISLQTAVILLPVHLLIGRLFLLIQPQKTLPLLPPTPTSRPSGAAHEPLSHTKVVEELKETVGFLLRRNTCLISECEQSLWSSCDTNKLVKLLSSLIYSQLEDQGCYQQAEYHQANVVLENHHHFYCYLLRVLQRLRSHLDLARVHQPCDFLEAAHQLQKLQELLETQILSMEQGPAREATSFPILNPGEEKPTSVCLPKLLICICWLLVGITSLASAFFTALYSLELNKDQATSWAVSMILSVLQDIFIGQPVKVIFFTLLFSLVVTRMPWLNKENEQQTKRILALWAKCSPSSPGSRDKNNPIYTAPTMDSSAKGPRRTWKKKKLFKLTADILVQVLFLILLMTSVYSSKNSNRYFLHQAILKSFSHRFSEIKLLKDFYPWANHTLLPNLYGDYRGFITDGNSFLLGNVLLRQIRHLPNAIFPVSLQERVKPSGQNQEDRKNYGVGWGPPDPNITKADSIWHYQNQESLGGSPIRGEFATYSGGGYAARLGRNSSTATRVLQHLHQTHWLDRCTKGLFVEFVVFNANVNLFCVVTLILESNSVGAFFTSVRLDSLNSLQTSGKGLAWPTASQVTQCLLICCYTFIQGCRIKQERWRFLTRKKNILDTSILLLSFSILGLDLRRRSLHEENLAQYRRDHERFISFYEAINVNSAVTHLVGFLVLLATVQLWDLLQHNPRLQVISKTLSKDWDEVVGFLLIILVLLSGYAMTFNVLFGWSISDYRTFCSSTVAVVGLLMGISPHKEVIALYPVLGSFLIITNVILMVLVIINLFVSAILIAFGKERKSLQKEATLTDMLLQKLSNLLGIRQHQNPSSEKKS